MPSALCVARQRGADVAVVAMGPGGVGTATELGFGALEVAAVLDAARWLGGRPVACLRYATADGRPRHHGVSHHSLTVLGRATAGRAVVPIPAGHLAAPIRDELATAGVTERHQVVVVDVPDVAGILAAAGVDVTTMGRTPVDDPAFFTVAGAAGVGAAAYRQKAGTVQW